MRKTLKIIIERFDSTKHPVGFSDPFRVNGILYRANLPDEIKEDLGKKMELYSLFEKIINYFPESGHISINVKKVD